MMPLTAHSANAASDGAQAALWEDHMAPEVAPLELLTLETLTSAAPHQRVAGCALVLRSDVATDRTGRPYLSLGLRGADGGRIEARWWRYPHPVEHRPPVGQICWLSGDLDTYNGEHQLRIREARPAPEVPPDHFVRTTRRSGEDLRAELAATMASLEPDLAALVGAVLSGDILARFATWPAAQHRHGAVRYGLLAHSLRVARLAECIAAAYGTDGLPHDAGVVTTACLLHDVGKTLSLPAVAGAPLPEDGLRCDHVTRGVLLLQAAAAQLEPEIAPARLEQVTHAVLAHHGRKEWGAAVEPQTVEARLVHLADLAEAQLWGWSNEEQA
jgi:3'-5' exoribonuclease